MHVQAVGTLNQCYPAVTAGQVSVHFCHKHDMHTQVYVHAHIW